MLREFKMTIIVTGGAGFIGANFVFHMLELFVELLMELFEDNYYFDYKQV